MAGKFAFLHKSSTHSPNGSLREFSVSLLLNPYHPKALPPVQGGLRGFLSRRRSFRHRLWFVVPHGAFGPDPITKGEAGGEGAPEQLTTRAERAESPDDDRAGAGASWLPATAEKIEVRSRRAAPIARSGTGGGPWAAGWVRCPTGGNRAPRLGAVRREKRSRWWWRYGDSLGRGRRGGARRRGVRRASCGCACGRPRSERGGVRARLLRLCADRRQFVRAAGARTETRRFAAGGGCPRRLACVAWRWELSVQSSARRLWSLPRMALPRESVCLPTDLNTHVTLNINRILRRSWKRNVRTWGW